MRLHNTKQYKNPPSLKLPQAVNVVDAKKCSILKTSHIACSQHVMFIVAQGDIKYYRHV